MTLWQKPCHYCSTSIETIGLDRIDSMQGYTLSNLVSCCEVCNWMKMNLTQAEFISHIQKISSNFSTNKFVGA